MTTTTTLHFTVPGMSTDVAQRVVDVLQERLHALNDLQLTLKHVHWNVVGPQFIAVHEMLDPQVDDVRGMADDVAERIATLGGSPVGTPGALVAERDWEDYSIGRAGTQAHLGALDLVYTGVVGDTRGAVELMVELDPVTEDILIGLLDKLELFHWFIRAHLEDTGGHLATADARSEQDAARLADAG